MSHVHPFALMSFAGLDTAESRAVGLVGFAVAALPTDPLGVFTLTLNNLVVGSAIQIESITGTPVENRTVASSTEVFTLSVYAPGSPLNNLKIKIRKGSSPPYYQSWETLVTSVVGSNSIYVAQILD